MNMNDRMYDFEQTIDYKQFLDDVDKEGDKDVRTMMQGRFMRLVRESKLDFSTDFQHK